jgi:hypothetical protein
LVFSFHLDLLSFAFDGAIYCLKNSDDVSSLYTAANRTLSQAHALKKVAALVLQRFRGLDPRADDVSVPDLEARLSIVQRLLFQSADALFKNSHLLNAVQVVEHYALVAPHNDDLTRFVWIGPADMYVTDDVAWIAE